MTATGAWKILIIDDDRLSRESLTDWLKGEGLAVVAVAEAAAAAPYLDDDLAAIVTDLKMPRAEGLELMRRAKVQAPHAAVILLAGYGAVEMAVAALKEGAFDYLTRPVKPADLVHKVRQALARRQMVAELDSLRAQLNNRYGLHGLVGESPAMRAVVETVRLAADAKSCVLITGERGTGKQLIAVALHHNSVRRQRPFVAVSCAAVPESFLETALFAQGAANHGGTLYLDHVEALGFGLQDRLLRALETGRVLSASGGPETEVDVRLVTATAHDLSERVASGKFSGDLYARLRVIEIRLPPLRERPEDIPALVRFFVREIATENQRAVPEVSAESLDVLSGYSWPGNVRELRSTLEVILALSTRQRIEVTDLPAPVRAVGRRGATMAEIEREAIRRTLQQTGGRRNEAARILDVSVRTLQRKIKEYDLPF
jgi:two-component system response regulator HydG